MYVFRDAAGYVIFRAPLVVYLNRSHENMDFFLCVLRHAYYRTVGSNGNVKKKKTDPTSPRRISTPVEL